MSMHRFLLLVLTFAMMSIVSCVGDEPANAECDIEQVWVHVDNPDAVFFHTYDTLYTVPSTVNDIMFQTRYDAVVGRVPVGFVITPKASIFRLDENKREVPFVNGDLVDFSNGREVTFRVRSESRQYQRDYSISIVPKQQTNGDMFFDFEESSYYLLTEGSSSYYLWKHDSAPMQPWWSCGNPGFRLSRSSAKAMEYPTTPAVGEGVDGSTCVKLTTCSTGDFGAMVNMRLAAGNLFIGTFDVAHALRNALLATKMGHPYSHKPIKLSGYYKYVPGKVKQDRAGKPMPDEQDYPDIYCVVYRNVDDAGQKIQMDGNILDTDKNNNPYADYIVGMARIKQEDIDCTGKQWVKFELPLTYTKDISREDVENEKYNTAVVFSSSNGGAYFLGAIGSTLWIDNVTLECEY